MVPTRARRFVEVAAASAALAVVLAGCGNAPPQDPVLDPAPAASFTVAEIDVCTELKRTADLKFQIIFSGQDEQPTRENVAQLRADLADYADDVRAAAERTISPTLRPALDNALAAAEQAAEVSSMQELRGTPFKSLGIELRRVCGELLDRAAAAEPEPAPPATEELAGGCDLPVVFDVTPGWRAAPARGAGTFDDGDIGPFSKVCEVSTSEPGDRRGSFSVATAPASAGDPLGAMVDYLAVAAESDAYDEIRPPTFTARRAAGGLAASEAVFQGDRDGDIVLMKVCVVTVPGGLVALRFNAFFDDDGAAFEDAYQLALQTLRLP